jgi:abequosyltransferase
MEILLSIAIPTYNRACFLERSLETIAKMIKGKSLPVEVIVCDNCSPDDTTKVVEKFNSKDLPIRYFRHSRNIGANLNVLKCYAEAKGQYVLCLGDDDVLINNAIEKILKIIQFNAGVIFLKSYAFQRNPYAEAPRNHSKGFTVYASAASFLRDVNYFITFISANVIRKEYFNYSYLLKYRETNLIQVAFILPAILHSNLNIVVEERLLAVQADNSGGYNLFKVFGVNLNSIMTDIFKRHNKARLHNILKHYLVVDFFPKWLKLIRSKDANLSLDDGMLRELDRIFWGSILYRKFTRKLLKKDSRMRSFILRCVYINGRIYTMIAKQLFLKKF